MIDFKKDLISKKYIFVKYAVYNKRIIAVHGSDKFNHARCFRSLLSFVMCFSGSLNRNTLEKSQWYK